MSEVLIFHKKWLVRNITGDWAYFFSEVLCVTNLNDGQSCAEPESFVREGQTLTTLSLSVMRGDMIQTPLKLECIQESLSQLKNRIMALLYERSSTRGTITKKLHFVSGNWRIEN